MVKINKKKKVYRDECIKFPSWIKISQTVCSIELTKQVEYHTIVDHDDGKNITIFSIEKQKTFDNHQQLQVIHEYH